MLAGRSVGKELPAGWSVESCWPASRYRVVGRPVVRELLYCAWNFMDIDGILGPHLMVSILSSRNGNSIEINIQGFDQISLPKTLGLASQDMIPMLIVSSRNGIFVEITMQESDQQN